MVSVEADPAKNLLKITYSGHVGADEAKEGVTQVRTLLPQLKPGFRLLTNMTGLEQMETSCIPIIR